MRDVGFAVQGERRGRAPTVRNGPDGILRLDERERREERLGRHAVRHVAGDMFVEQPRVVLIRRRRRVAGEREERRRA
jgi:hypothetical protein